MRKIAYKCVICRKKFAKPTTQMMDPLPFFRLPSSLLHPFDHCAIDVAGPFMITHLGKKHKRWMLVFRCSTVGAVHLEMLDSMDTSWFLMAVERFLAVRPRPTVFLADNRSNFKGGLSTLKVRDQIDVSEAQGKFNITFRFAPPQAPHFMGLVERIVGAAKAVLRPALGTRIVSAEELRTVIAQTMGIINNFPIVYMTRINSDFHYKPLTANHFLLGQPYTELQAVDTKTVSAAK
jgi:hypothetical protein